MVLLKKKGVKTFIMSAFKINALNCEYAEEKEMKVELKRIRTTLRTTDLERTQDLRSRTGTMNA